MYSNLISTTYLLVLHYQHVPTGKYSQMLALYSFCIVDWWASWLLRTFKRFFRRLCHIFLTLSFSFAYWSMTKTPSLCTDENEVVASQHATRFAIQKERKADICKYLPVGVSCPDNSSRPLLSEVGLLAGPSRKGCCCKWFSICIPIDSLHFKSNEYQCGHFCGCLREWWYNIVE